MRKTVDLFTAVLTADRLRLDLHSVGLQIEHAACSEDIVCARRGKVEFRRATSSLGTHTSGTKECDYNRSSLVSFTLQDKGICSFGLQVLICEGRAEKGSTKNSRIHYFAL
jgi:hypothetical protein